MIYTTYHHPYGGATIGQNITPMQATFVPAEQEPAYVLPEDRARMALRIVCTMRESGYTDEQIARTLRKQIGGITDVEISTAISTAPCPRIQPELPQIQTAPPPEEPPELPFPDEGDLTWDEEPEPDYAAELLPPPQRGWWSKWWWAAALGVAALGVGGYVLLKK